MMAILPPAKKVSLAFVVILIDDHLVSLGLVLNICRRMAIASIVVTIPHK